MSATNAGEVPLLWHLEPVVMDPRQTARRLLLIHAIDVVLRSHRLGNIISSPFVAADWLFTLGPVAGQSQLMACREWPAAQWALVVSMCLEFKPKLVTYLNTFDDPPFAPACPHPSNASLVFLLAALCCVLLL